MQEWINFNALKDQWLQDKDFCKEYENLDIEFRIALGLIEARSQAGLTQKEVAEKMGTTQSVIARLESGKMLPSVKTLDKYAKATGKQLGFHIH